MGPPSLFFPVAVLCAIVREGPLLLLGLVGLKGAKEGGGLAVGFALSFPCLCGLVVVMSGPCVVVCLLLFWLLGLRFEGRKREGEDFARLTLFFSLPLVGCLRFEPGYEVREGGEPSFLFLPRVLWGGSSV